MHKCYQEVATSQSILDNYFNESTWQTQLSTFIYLTAVVQHYLKQQSQVMLHATCRGIVLYNSPQNVKRQRFSEIVNVAETAVLAWRETGRGAVHAQTKWRGRKGEIVSSSAQDVIVMLGRAHTRKDPYKAHTRKGPHTARTRKRPLKAHTQKGPYSERST